MIQVEHLVKRYGNDENRPRAVNDVSFTVPEGGFYTLVGPSGCGKTTTLRSIAGLERPNSGTIRLGDNTVHSQNTSVPTHARSIGMVFQNYAVWPHMNVFENVAFPLRVETRGRRSDPTEIKRRVARALEIVGLSGLEDRMSTQLSGGQQQRLSFARAVVREPKVLLLDEPLSNLDAKLREQMRRDLKVLHHDLGITSLFVTHDQVEALSMSDRIGVMRAGQIVQEGTPEDVYHRPVSEFVATFIGSTNLVRGSVVGVDGDRVSVETPLGVLTGTAVQRPRVGDAASIAVRPEDLVVQRADPDRSQPSPGRNRLLGRIHVGMFAGSYAEYEVVVGDVHLNVRSGSRLPFDRGVAVEVEFGVDCTRVFSGEGLGHAVESADETVETPATAEPLNAQAVVVGQG